MLALGGLGVTCVAIFCLVTGQREALRNPQNVYSECANIVFCKLSNTTCADHFADPGVVWMKFIYFFSLNMNLAFVCKLGFTGMVLNHRTCMAAIDSIREEFNAMSKDTSHSRLCRCEKKEPKEQEAEEEKLLKRHKEAFASQVQQINDLKYELSMYWKGKAGISWTLGLICMAAVIAAGVNGLAIHLFQTGKTMRPSDRVGILSPLWLVCSGGGLALLTIKILSDITSRCANKAVKAKSIVGELENYRMTWFENRKTVDPSWIGMLNGYQTLLLSQQMGVNLLGLQYVDSAWLSSLVVKGCVAAPAAYTVCVGFLTRFLTQHEEILHNSTTASPTL